MKKELWHATFRPSVLGLVIKSVRRDKQKSTLPGLAPDHVVQFLMIKRIVNGLYVVYSHGEPAYKLLEAVEAECSGHNEKYPKLIKRAGIYYWSGYIDNDTDPIIDQQYNDDMAAIEADDK